ncbi:MAG: ABC transporter permease, partial [Acidobacteriota bacterium]
MSQLLSDFRIAARTLSTQRRFTILAVLTLALGLSFTTAFFSIFDTILLRPLNYADSESLVAVLQPGRSPTAPGNFVDLKAGASSLEAMTAATPWRPVMRGQGPPEQLAALRSTPGLFDLLGVEPLIGRTYQPDGRSLGEDGPRVLVMGYALWQTRFGGDAAIVGRALELDGESFTVIGIMPEGFEFPPFWATGAELWAPFTAGREFWTERDTNSLRVFARLAEETEIAAAQKEVDRIAAALQAEYPDDNATLSYRVEAMSEPVVEGIRPALQTILLGVGLVLLIACANVTSLWLTRTATRAQELAVRRALGARGWSLWRQGLAESLCVMVLAVGLGWQLALWGLEAVKTLAPPGVPRLQEAALDGRIFAFTASVGLILTLGFSCFLPLLIGGEKKARLAAAARRLGNRGESRGRSWLVTGEIAMALMLLLASGLMAKSLLNLWRTDSGLRDQGVLTAELPFGGSEVAAPEQQSAFFDRLIAQAESVPGVESAALINHLHLGGDIWTTRVQVEGQPVDSSARAPSASFKVVSEGLFETFGIELLEG